MNPTPTRLVSGAAAAAVSIAALAAMWAEREPAHRLARTLAAPAERPAADAPVQVVKAPPLAQLRHWPVQCRDCAAWRERTL